MSKLSLKKLTLQFIPFSEVEHLSSGERIRKLLKLIIANKIVLLQGRLKANEEIRLIEDTMAMVDHIKGFKGIELAVLSSSKEIPFFDVVKNTIAKILIGDRDAVTVIGPASIIHEIKKDPSKMELLISKK